MKLELSKDETVNVFGVYGSALKDAAEGRAQITRLSEKLQEAETAKRTAIRNKEDTDYNLTSVKADLEYQKGNYKNLQTQYNTLSVDIRNVRTELAEAKRVIAEQQAKLNVPAIPSLAPALPTIAEQIERDIKVLTPILDAIAHGNTIDAIKQVRTLTQLGLKEAKDMVEGRALNQAPVNPPKPAKSGCGGSF